METKHTATAAAPAAVVYDLVADITQGPRFFPTVVHAEYLEQNGDTDRIQRWTLQGDTVRTWRARRTLDRAAGRITFNHENPEPPVKAVTGVWSITAQDDGQTHIELAHEVDTTGPLTALENGARAQVARLKEVAEQYEELAALEVSYESTLVIDAALEDVYDYFYQSELWPERIPHCLTVEKTEDTPGTQIVEMQVRVPSGAIHTTRQARVCLPGEGIVWRQIGGLPPLDAALYGYTRFSRTPEGVLARAGQTELLKPEMVAKRGWDVQEAKDHVSEVRGARTLDALRSAQDYLRRVRETAGQR